MWCIAYVCSQRIVRIVSRSRIYGSRLLCLAFKNIHYITFLKRYTFVSINLKNTAIFSRCCHVFCVLYIKDNQILLALLNYACKISSKNLTTTLYTKTKTKYLLFGLIAYEIKEVNGKLFDRTFCLLFILEGNEKEKRKFNIINIVK